MKYTDGSMYEGQWREGLQNGNGTLIDKKGKR